MTDRLSVASVSEVGYKAGNAAARPKHINDVENISKHVRLSFNNGTK